MKIISWGKSSITLQWRRGHRRVMDTSDENMFSSRSIVKTKLFTLSDYYCFSVTTWFRRRSKLFFFVRYCRTYIVLCRGIATHINIKMTNTSHSSLIYQAISCFGEYVLIERNRFEWENMVDFWVNFLFLFCITCCCF